MAPWWHSLCLYLLLGQFDIVCKEIAAEIAAFNALSTLHSTLVLVFIDDNGAIWKLGYHSAGHFDDCDLLVYGAGIVLNFVALQLL